MIRVLVTGAGGQLGQHLRQSTSEYPDMDFTFVSKEELDITDEIALDTIFNGNPVDFCINTAAYTDVDGAEKLEEETFRVNATGVKPLALSCHKRYVTLV